MHDTGERFDFMGLPLADPGVDGLIDWLVHPEPSSVAPRAAAYLNAHTVNMALRSDSELAPLLRPMDLLYPDGMSVVRAARRRGFPVSERVSAADFFLRFCWAAAARGRTVALVGGTPEVVAGCSAFLSEQVPALRIVLARDGFLKPREEPALAEELGRLRPDITLLGMGSPRQERLALTLRDNIGLPTVWCVGALFEYHAPGHRPHAPLWMRRAGMEWAFRLWQEPRRLARRYLLGNAEFLLRTRFGGTDKPQTGD